MGIYKFLKFSQNYLQEWWDGAMILRTSKQKATTHGVVNRYGILTGKHHFSYLMEELLLKEKLK
jgi:hypothetical protein